MTIPDYYLLDNLLTDEARIMRDRVRAFVDAEILPVILSEPNHGSDSVGLETTVRRDRDAWVLNGAKRRIGNASIADIVVVWARDTADGRVKAIVVEKKPDGTYSDGYTAELITGKIGKRAIWQPDVTLHDVRVPLDNKLAEAHSFRDATRVLTSTRGSAAWESLGHAIASYDIALTYAKTRIQENHIARHLTDMEVVHTYEGTDNIQSLLIGRDITGISAIT